MRILNSQNGYALLLMLTGLSAASLSIVVVSSMSSSGRWYLLTQDAFQLNNERDRLIYYAVDYANLYGSGGAGPGHMPCPDTDESAQRPGPNPPCGQAGVASGKVPDGVTRASGRIALTDSLLERSAYTLSRAVVNNPSLPINAMHWPEEIRFESSSMGYVTLSRPSGQERILNKKHIEKSTLQWVRAWLLWQLLETPLKYCDKRSVSNQKDVDSSLVGFCSKQIYTDELAVNTVADTNSNADTNADSLNDSTINLCVEENSLCAFSEYEALSWLRNGELEQWGSTRLSNHWFVKNHWLELFEIQTQKTCLNRAIDCVLYLDDIEQTLHFRLLPAAANEDDK